MTSPRSRTLVAAVCAVYIASFHVAYAIFLAPAFGYFGFRMDQGSLIIEFLAFALAWIPALWLPVAVRKPTELTYWILYLTVYAPSVMVPTYVGRLELSRLAPVVLALAASFSMLRWVHLLNPLRIRRRTMSPALFHAALLIPAALFSVYLVAKFHSQFRLVSFGGVYDQRATSTDAMAAIDRYITMWLATGFNPLLMTYGLFRRRPLWLLAGIGGQVLIYALTALKNVLLMPPIYLLLYGLVVRRRESLGLLAGCGASGVLVFTLLIHAVSNTGWSFLLSAIIIMRTFGVPGLCTQQYYEFFSAHPLTYFSHVNGVNLLIHYPYSRSIYYEIGDAFYRNPDLSANAHFWAMDGIAALGIPGMVVMSVLCGFLFWAFDSLGELAGNRFVTVILISIGIQLSNGSLFTTLTTGGGLLLAFYLFFMPAETAPPSGVAAEGQR